VTTANVVVGKDLAVSGNATVTGDLNVSGALGILDAIYPVGTVIDRATAITDTHLNGKYKAFLAAPNQEWELVSDGQDVVPLEYLSQAGTSTSFCGRGTLLPATAKQELTVAYSSVTGTEVTEFTPVFGTKKIKYSCDIHLDFTDNKPLINLMLQYKEGTGSWTDVSYSLASWYNGSNTSGSSPTRLINISWTFTLDDVDNSNEGRLSAERPTLGLRVVGSDYDSAFDGSVHSVRYPSPSGSAAVFRPPVVDIVSLGPEANLKYKRTV